MIQYRRRGLVDLLDPDAHYAESSSRGSQLENWSSDEEEEYLRLGPSRGHATPAENGLRATDPNVLLPLIAPTLPSLISSLIPPPETLDPTAIHDRKGWQSFLASVLSGDILQGESVRIGEERGVDEAFRQDFGRSLWWQIRGRLRKRTEEDEKRRITERRANLVDRVLEQVDGFTVKPSSGVPRLDRRLSSEDAHDVEEEEEERDHQSEIGALDQVNYVLQKLYLVESLYPTFSAMRDAKPLYNSTEFQDKVDAMSAWSTLVSQLQAQLVTLQKWTGSDDLDITKPNTTREKPLVGKNRYHPDGRGMSLSGDQVADDSTFLDRIMKEESLKRTFEKRIFADITKLIDNARETVIDHSQDFKRLKLPDFTYELVRLIGFPGKLIIEVLKVRLDAAKKLNDPNPMVIDDMIESFRLIMDTAVEIKARYLEVTAMDPEKIWQIPPCLPLEYDAVLLNGLKAFFRLMTFKLRSSDRHINLREVEVLESHVDFLQQIGEMIPGGDLVVVESFW